MDFSPQCIWSTHSFNLSPNTLCECECFHRQNITISTNCDDTTWWWSAGFKFISDMTGWSPVLHVDITEKSLQNSQHWYLYVHCWPSFDYPLMTPVQEHIIAVAVGCLTNMCFGCARYRATHTNGEPGHTVRVKRSDGYQVICSSFILHPTYPIHGLGLLISFSICGPDTLSRLSLSAVIHDLEQLHRCCWRMLFKPAGHLHQPKHCEIAQALILHVIMTTFVVVCSQLALCVIKQGRGTLYFSMKVCVSLYSTRLLDLWITF